MAYFPNGTAIRTYQDMYCEQCVHDADRNCRLLLAHLTVEYAEKSGETSPAGKVLDLLIENDDRVGAKQCSMFIPIEAG